MRQYLSLNDFDAAARRILPRPLYSYVAGHAEDGSAFRHQREAFDALAFLPRVMVDVTSRDTAIELFGEHYAMPFGIAPMGLCALAAYDGDVALAGAAHEARIPFVLSGSSLTRLEEVVRHCPNLWFQAYFYRDPAERRSLIGRAKAAGVQTLVVTVDTPVAANREGDIRAGFSSPLRPTPRLAWAGASHPRWLLGTLARTVVRKGMPHFENTGAGRGAPAFSATAVRDFAARGCFAWDDLRTLRAQWTGKLVVKGILRKDDAVSAAACGVDAIVVSSHGGRQLDCAVAPLEVLASIVDACPSIPVLIDGGFRRGTDVLKALALGARAALVGRPFCFAAAAGGPEAVRHAIRLLAAEVSRDMALLGACSVANIDRSLIRARGLGS